MITTIGSLVQETSTRISWFIATSLYILACFGSSLALGALLGGLGELMHLTISKWSMYPSLSAVGVVFVSFLAMAYALSDVGLLHLPHPSIWDAVPLVWWRRWRPYGASLAYGAALGLGVMTRVRFGAFYIICLWCVLRGDAFYGAMLLGTYGLLRALVLIPASWSIYGRKSCNEITCESRLPDLYTFLNPVRFIVGAALLLLALGLIAATFIL